MHIIKRVRVDSPRTLSVILGRHYRVQNRDGFVALGQGGCWWKYLGCDDVRRLITPTMAFIGSGDRDLGHSWLEACRLVKKVLFASRSLVCNIKGS
jgi:hypothetical protein